MLGPAKTSKPQREPRGSEQGRILEAGDTGPIPAEHDVGSYIDVLCQLLKGYEPDPSVASPRPTVVRFTAAKPGNPPLHFQGAGGEGLGEQALSPTLGNGSRSHRDTVGHMSDSSVQRSFRLSERTLTLLDAASKARHESRNALVDRLLSEAIRTETHPLIRFHRSASGRRQPQLVGTRLYVYQVISTLRESDGDVEEAASFLGLRPQQVRAALVYYADFKDEVDDDEATARQVELDERARWERQQRALA